MARWLLLALLPLATFAQSIEGEWNASAGKLDLRLTIAKSGPDYGGSLQNTGDPALAPLSKVKLTDSLLSFQVTALKAAFEGTLRDTTLEGTWTQPGLPPQPLTFRRIGQLSGKPFPIDLDVRVFSPPTTVPANGSYFCVYELHFNNFNSQQIELQHIEVWSGEEKLFTLAGEKLAASLARHPASKGPVFIEAEKRLIVLLFFSSSPPVPSLHHKVQLKFPNYSTPVELDVASVTVAADPVRIAPPLRGTWSVLNGLAALNHHRTSIGAFHGMVTVPQRFAIDFARLGPDKEPFHGDYKINSNHYAYGAEVFAVADAIVANVVDGLPENAASGDERALPLTTDTAAGNAISLDLGGGRFAHYAHLQPGSLKVKIGDKVRRGQLLGLVGNSGNSSGPHLHFQVTDGLSFLGSEGIPYVFDSFVHDGKDHRNEMPFDQWTIQFP